MKRTVIAWTIVALATTAVLAWVAGNTYWTNAPEPGLRNGEALFDPHYALQRFTQSLGARLEVTGPLAALPPHDAVLLLEDWNWSFSPAQSLAIRHWVEAGGRLLATEPEGTDSQFGAWAGADWSRVRKPGSSSKDENGDEDDDEAEVAKPPADKAWQDDDRKANANCLALRLQSGATPSDPDATLWRLCGVPVGHYWKAHRAAQLSIGTRDGPQLLRLGLGRGSVTFMQGDSTFNNCCLLDGDHARLLVIALQLRHGDRVRLMCGDYERSLVGWLWQVGAPLMLLLGAALLLALWRLLPRFGPLLPAPVAARRSLRAQVAGTAAFLAHRGGGEALWQASCHALRAAAARTLSADEAADPGRLVAALGRRGFLGTAALERALLRPELRTPAALANGVATIERARRFVAAWSDRQSGNRQSIDRGKA